MERSVPFTAATDDATLVKTAAAGDREAFGELYRRYARAVHGTLLARLSPPDADDMVQEVFLHVMSRLADIRDPSAFAAWICAVARRKAIDHYRRTVRSEELPADLAATDDPSARADANAAIAAIQSLPEAYRETLTLRLVEGLSGPQIAVVTGLTADSVRVNLHRGFKLLRERLGIV